MKRKNLTKRILQHMIDEWLKYEDMSIQNPNLDKACTSCFIAARNYYEYLIEGGHNK